MKYFIFAFCILALSCNNPTSKKVAETKVDSTALKEAREHKHDDTTNYQCHTLEVTGEVKHPLSLTIDSLKSMSVVTGTDADIVCESGSKKSEIGSFKGVTIKSLIEKAELKQESHKERGFYFVAEAADGYKAIFSWGELFNSEAGEKILVLFEKDGKKIEPKGDFAVLCLNDLKTGPRHVYFLKSIKVCKVN
jgi:hypothetical protein